MKSAIFSQKDFSSLPDNLDKTIFCVMAAEIANKKTAEFSNKVLNLLNLIHEVEKRASVEDYGFEYHEDAKSLVRTIKELEVFVFNGGVMPEVRA